MRTLAELAAEYNAITKEADILWQTEWKPKFDVTMSETQFTRVIYEMLAAAGVSFTDELPGLLSVNICFAKDALRQRMKT